MQTPPNSRKRRRSSQVDHSVAERTAYRVKKSKRRETPAAKKFKKKVLKVLKEPSPTGIYNHLTYVYIPIVNAGAATIVDTDMGDITQNNANRTVLEFFSPRQFKDAEAVCFNGKSPQHAGWIYQNEAAGVNLPYNQITRVNNSSVAMHIKNFGVHHMILQIFKFTGKGGGSNRPRLDIEDAYGKLSNFTLTGFHRQTETFRNMGTSLSNLPEEFHQKWEIEVTSYEFEPGEETWHFIKGPRSYNMNGSKKIETVDAEKKATAWKGPNFPGSGCYVMFRAFADFALVSGGTEPQTAGQQPPKMIVDSEAGTVQINGAVVAWANEISSNTFSGGLGISIQRKYNMEMPEGLDPSNPSNALKIFNGVAVPHGGTIFPMFTDENLPIPGYIN